MSKYFVISFILYSFMVLGCHSYYMVLKEGDRKCFFEEVPKETLIVGNFQTEDTDEILQAKGNNPNFADSVENKKIGIIVTVRDPSGQLVLSQTFERNSKFAFSSTMGGIHEICFQTDTSSWFNPFSYKFHVSIKTGSSGIDYEAIEKREKLDKITLQVRKLNDKVRGIRNEQQYQKTRESEFRETSEDTYTRVYYWSLLQITIVILTAAWQVRHLKGFFNQKKQQ